MKRGSILSLTVAALTLGAAGCVVAAAGAGAGGGIYLTSRGVESVIAHPVADVARAAEAAFGELGIERTGLEVDDERGRRVLRGEPEGGEPDVTVSLQPEGDGSTRVEVTARTSVVTWDKDYARTVIEKIVELAS